MKSKIIESDRERELHNEFILFLSLCGENDRAFFAATNRQRKPYDYARLMTISLVFGFKGTCLKLAGKMQGETFNKCMEILSTVKNDAATSIKWFEEFVKNVPIPEFKQETANVWSELRKRINEDHFDITSLLGNGEES